MQMNSTLTLATAPSQVSVYPMESPMAPFFQPYEVIAHDAVTPFAEMVHTGAIGNAITKLKPGGLQDTGSSTGGCNDESMGQTYVRANERSDGKLAIIYAWYMPKDMPTDGVSTGLYRHDWENVVVFADSPTADSGASLVEYFINFPTNHELQFTDTFGRNLALVDWDAIPQAARDGLAAADFGCATVPFKDDTFDGNLDKASS
ncbi:putative necrosis- and ethylene-inducing protein 1 precursor protein [Eutypa lata UCREL1]|uniref:Putative necrosis-and ethylene-inducing protein 1 protein n=1 Tax=Eutypa lata (strain UCR-EL1) TaxID=1287681 RepID=M7T8V7_EUTLA|nr:putative necrosis- and ethylene-inducing protein 1 precursor protein [Eutypa lata UCREL1]